MRREPRDETWSRNQEKSIKETEKSHSEVGGKSGKGNVIEAQSKKKKSVSRRRDQLSSMPWRDQMR